MNLEEFRGDLPTEVLCDQCGGKLSGLDWQVRRFGEREWMAICVAKCGACNWVKVAAAGSSHEAHHRAQMSRAAFIASLGSRGLA